MADISLLTIFLFGAGWQFSFFLSIALSVFILYKLITASIEHKIKKNLSKTKNKVLG